jgi:hypothetical protein
MSRGLSTALALLLSLAPAGGRAEPRRCAAADLTSGELLGCLNDPAGPVAEKLGVVKQAEGLAGEHPGEVAAALRVAAFQDDAAVRRAVLDLLVQLKALDAQVAERLPTASGLTRLVRAATARQDGWFAAIAATHCALDADGRVACAIAGPCRGACRHFVGHVALRLDGRAWKSEVTVKDVDDGRCGCCL